MLFSWTSFISLLRPPLDLFLYLKTEIKKQETGWFYYVFQIYRIIDGFIYGKTKEPCWETGLVYNVVDENRGMPLYIQKNHVGFWVCSLSTLTTERNQIVCEKMSPCFIYITYKSKTGVRFDIDLEPEFYLSGNELFSAGFINWWIKTRLGVYWTNYSPNEPYSIGFMDNQLNVFEIGPNDAIILDKKSLLGYKKISLKG